MVLATRAARGDVSNSADRVSLLLDAYQRLEALHMAFEGAALMLERARAAPLCVEGCGKCCESNVPYVWGIEAEYILSCTPGIMSGGRLVQAAEDWLLARDPRLTLFGPPKGLSARSPDYSRRLLVEWAQVFQGGCPLLTMDKRCSVRPSRPLVCRAYGVSHIPDPFCPRPLTLGEHAARQMYFEEPATLRDLLIQTISGIPDPELRLSWPLPTAIARWARPEQFMMLEQGGRVPTARLLRMRRSPSVIWQTQRDSMVEALLNEAAEPVPLVPAPETADPLKSALQVHEHASIRDLRRGQGRE